MTHSSRRDVLADTVAPSDPRSPGASAVAGGSDPDYVLHELLERIRDAHHVYCEANQRADDVIGQFRDRAPRLPAEAVVSVDELTWLKVPRALREKYIREMDCEWGPNKSVIGWLADYLRVRAQFREAWGRDGLIYVACPQRQARADQILAACDGWLADHARLKAELGLEAAEEIRDLRASQLRSLEILLINSEATTFSGLAAKAGLLEMIYGQDLWTDTEDSPATDSIDTKVAFRLAMDVLKLAGRGPSHCP